MNKFEHELLSKSAYARYLGINEKSIRKAIDEGKIVKGYDVELKKIIVGVADDEYGFQHLTNVSKPGVSKLKRAEKFEAEIVKKKPTRSEKKNSPKSEFSDESPKSENSDQTGDDVLNIQVDSSLDYKEAVRRKEIIALALEKKKLEELNGQLVRKDDVYKVLFAFGSQLKKAIVNIPNRCIDDVLNAENKIEALNVLNDEINNVLEIYSNFENISIKGND